MHPPAWLFCVLLVFVASCILGAIWTAIAWLDEREARRTQQVLATWWRSRYDEAHERLREAYVRNLAMRKKIRGHEAMLRRN